MARKYTCSENDAEAEKCIPHDFAGAVRRRTAWSEPNGVMSERIARKLYRPPDDPALKRGNAEFLRLQKAALNGIVYVNPLHPAPMFIKTTAKAVPMPLSEGGHTTRARRERAPSECSKSERPMVEEEEQPAGTPDIVSPEVAQSVEENATDGAKVNGNIPSSNVAQSAEKIPRGRKIRRQNPQTRNNNELIYIMKDLEGLQKAENREMAALQRITPIFSSANRRAQELIDRLTPMGEQLQGLVDESEALAKEMSDPFKNNVDLERKLGNERLQRYRESRNGVAKQKTNHKTVKARLRDLQERINDHKILKLEEELEQVLTLLERQKQFQEKMEAKWISSVPADIFSDNWRYYNVAEGRSRMEVSAGASAQAERLEDIDKMATIVSHSLPTLPQGWSADKDFKPIGKLSPATQRSIEPVGPHFLAHARRARHKRTFSEDDRIQAQENVKKVEEEDDGDISEPEDPMMLSRDAKDWKGQDHYAVLGLSKYRYRATEDQIKRAHRKKVLRHHPDKKAAAGSTEDDSFFKCIQKAHEILTDPVKRRQFDSVDEHADVEPPSKKVAKGTKFYSLWSKVFESEGRFSKIQPVPKFGKIDSTQEEVEAFYNFFYTFDSWRSFEYQDEDVPDDNEGREQKRHTERKNNNARKKKKTEDSARLRKLVEDAQAGDERIARFRQEANAAKNKKKLDKEAREKKSAEEAQAKKDAEGKAKKDAEEKAKADKDQGKKAKEAAKAAVKKNRRVLKGSVKDANYFVKGGDPDAAAIDAVLNDVDIVQGKVDPDEIAALAGKLNGLKVAGEIKSVWADEVKRLVAAGKVKDGEIKTLA